MKRKKPNVKVKIPWQLYMKIVKLQGEEELDWEEACKKAAKLVDTNSRQFREDVKAEANRAYQSRHMSELNKAKKTWVQKGYEKCIKETRITYPCSICGGELEMKQNSKDHEAMKKLMKQAGWAHISCFDK